MRRTIKAVFAAAVVTGTLGLASPAAFATVPGGCHTNGGGGVGAGSGVGGSSGASGAGSGSVGPNGQGNVDANGLPLSSTDPGPLCE